MKRFWIAFVIGAALTATIYIFAIRTGMAQESAAWNAFAAVGDDPLPVEGKKPKPDKNRHDDDFKPTPAPAPEPDAKPVPIPKRPDSKPHVVKPNKPKLPDVENPNGGHHNGDKTVTNIVYKTSWVPLVIAYAWLGLLSFVAFVQARKSGLALSTFLTFWK